MNGPRKVPILVNGAEQRADALLRDIGQDQGHRLLTKVRLADAIEPGEWMQSRPSYGAYALKAHLDFVMVSAETSNPIFAVEIDGSQHYRDLGQRRRDLMKDELCREAGLPLLRVGSDFARREGKYVLLRYLCDVYYRSLAFDDAQRAGHILPNEPYIHFLILDTDPDDGRIYFGSIDAKARVELHQLYDAGKVAHYAPDIWTGSVDEWGNVRSDAYLGAGDDMTLVGTATVRDFAWFGLGSIELAEELAVLHLRDEAKRWAAGEAAGWRRAEFQGHFNTFVGEHRPHRYSWSSGPNGEPQVPYPAGPKNAATFSVGSAARSQR